ncbi:integrase [Paraburkholderia bengalensis]|uniref:Integrase n=1 Tax=Paraburkholderia bengalensis TaxID=2747562 RepID=A0ABU8J3B3_9BURK
MLLLLHSGAREGGTPYKWLSVTLRIRPLARFSGYCARRGLKSFRTLDQLPSLKLRTILLGFLMDSEEDGGMNAKVFTSCYKSARDALKCLSMYALVVRSDFAELVNELTLPEIDRHETQHRLRHAIIPTGVMKRVITEAAGYVEQAEAKFDEFAAVFRETHQGIVAAKCVDPAAAVYSTARKAARRLKSLLYEYFRDLQLHTYALVLAFTGMRDGEAGALKTGCAGRRTEGGETVFYVRSMLSKTDDNAISLDWIANEPAWRAVALLSKVNELYYERARLVQQHYGEHLAEDEKNIFRHGLANRWLFGLRLTVFTANFVRYTKGGDGIHALNLSHYRIPVTDADMVQLEEMECNYRSVAGNSGNRGKPYRVGDPFNLTAHQFRHTFAWFIIANRLGDLDDIKYQFKHLHRAMTFVYAERGFKSLNELRSVIEHFETFVSGRSVNDIVQSVVAGRVAGGGGERLARMLASLNSGMSDEVFGTEQQPHFRNVKDVVTFTTRHSESIRGLPHGYCTKGPSCKIRNAADPSHCLYCDTYFATPKHLPYWRAIKANCEARIGRIDGMPNEARGQFQAFRQSLEDNLFAANRIIYRLAPEESNTMDAR